MLFFVSIMPKEMSDWEETLFFVSNVIFVAYIDPEYLDVI